MKQRFILVIITLILLFGGWLYLSYDNAISQQAKLDDITRLPIYAYVSDSTQVAAILNELKPIPAIKSINHETAQQASQELINAYGLPLSEDMIKDYALPSVITVNLQPVYAAIISKPLILDALRRHLDESDIDSQAGAFNDLPAELKLIRNRMIWFTVFAGIALLLVSIFIRLSFELHVLLNYQGRRHSVVDKLRHHKLGVQHTWTMLLLPYPVCAIGYFAYVYFRGMPQLIPWWVFVAQLGTSLLAALSVHFILHTFEREVEFSEQPVEVLSQITSPGEPANE